MRSSGGGGSGLTPLGADEELDATGGGALEKHRGMSREKAIGRGRGVKKAERCGVGRWKMGGPRERVRAVAGC